MYCHIDVIPDIAQEIFITVTKQREARLRYRRVKSPLHHIRSLNMQRRTPVSFRKRVSKLFEEISKTGLIMDADQNHRILRSVVGKFLREIIPIIQHVISAAVSAILPDNGTTTALSKKNIATGLVNKMLSLFIKMTYCFIFQYIYSSILNNFKKETHIVLL